MNNNVNNNTGNVRTR